MWNDDNIKFLKENYSIFTAEELAEKLGMTVSAIRNKVVRLGLKKQRSLTTKQVAKVVNLSKSHSVKDIVNMVKLPEGTVRNIIHRNTKDKDKKGRRFTKEEINIIKSRYPHHRYSYESIAKSIYKKTGRVMNDNAIKAAANRLGLKRGIDFSKKGNSRAWTKSEERALRKYYPDESIPLERVCDEIYLVTGRIVKSSALSRKARRLGLRRGRARLWHKKQVKYLEDNIDKKSYSELAKELGMTEVAVWNKASLLGFRKTSEYATIKQVKEVIRRYPTDGVVRIAADLGLTPGAVRGIAYRNGVKKVVKKIKPKECEKSKNEFTEGEIEFLIKNSKDMTISEMARVLNRSVASIDGKVKRMNLVKLKSFSYYGVKSVYLTREEKARKIEYAKILSKLFLNRGLVFGGGKKYDNTIKRSTLFNGEGLTY